MTSADLPIMDKTVQQCLVPGCESDTDSPGIILFDFPSTDREQIRAWNKALGFRANCKHIPDPKVCQKHFDESQIDRNDFPIRRLVHNAVPIALKNNEATEKPGEPYYCRLCAKVERQPLKNSLEKMMKCSDTAKLLEICLESNRNNESLPEGVCDACSHMMKFLIKFVRTCCGAQGKLAKIFADAGESDGSDDSKPHPEEIIAPKIKKEEDETSNELPTDYLEIGIENETKDNDPQYIVDEETETEPTMESESKDDFAVDVKLEPSVLESDSDFELPKDFPASSSSESESGSDDDDYEPDVENMEEVTKGSAVKSEKGEEEAPSKAKLRKRRGRPRKNESRSPKGSKESRKPREKRDKKCTEDKPASLCKQICQICGKILSSSATFNVHMMTHTQQKDIVCPICDRRFYVKQQLKIHIESIHEKKDFVCSICGLKCRWRKSLRRHMLLHDENPYKHKCTYCDKAFARPNQLRYHVMKHTGDRVYCDICGADYRFNYMLTQHKIRKHGIVVEGVQLYKQSARKKKSESGGEQNARRSRVVTSQQTNIQLQSLEPQSATLPPMTLADHDRTNQSDLTHVSDMGSPATNACFATVASPEPPHFANHPQSHQALQQQQHHHQPTQIGSFNGAGINTSMPPGIIGFPSMSRQ